MAKYNCSWPYQDRKMLEVLRPSTHDKPDHMWTREARGGQDYLPSIMRAKPEGWKADNPDLPELPEKVNQTMRLEK